jgi:hypothetical protein
MYHFNVHKYNKLKTYLLLTVKCVVRLVKEIEIVIDDYVFKAKLLEDLAPKTCEIIYNALPISSDSSKDKGAVHSAWSGEVIMIRWDFDKLPLKIPTENQTIYAREGVVACHDMHAPLNEIYIVYRYGYFHYWRGSNPYNEFAKITDDLDKLAEIGRRIQLEGRKKFLMRKKGST